MQSNGIDKVIDFGTGFDWITPLISLIRGASGHSRGITIRRESYVPVKILLDRQGTEMYRVIIMGDVAVFDVKTERYESACRVLEEHGYIEREQ